VDLTRDLRLALTVGGPVSGAEKVEANG